MKRALVIRHARAETLAGNFTSALRSENFQLETLNIFDDAPGYRKFPAPPVEEISLIIALGGPMSANDNYPALREEREYLGSAMAAGKPVMGICLGAYMPVGLAVVTRIGGEQHAAEYVAWAWAINGFFSVIGSMLVTIFAMTYGFPTVLLGATLLYVFAALVLSRIDATSAG